MKNFFRLICLLALVTVGAVACDKDKDDDVAVTFEDEVAYFAPGESRALNFSARDIVSLKVTVKPSGWKTENVVVSNGYVMVTAPAASETGEKSGTLSLYATNTKGDTSVASIFVAISDNVDLSDLNANSYILNKPNTSYTIDVSHRPDGTKIATKSVDILWQTSSKLVQYITLDNGKASFYVSSKGNSLTSGNALLGGYDAKGNLLWSWHLWIADYDPDTATGIVEFNGYEMMARNLGALLHSNLSTSNIQQSFGLYYQWGRKDPFIYPSTYNSIAGASASLYNKDGRSVALKYESSAAGTGTVEYATAHPLSYITGNENSGYDWMQSGSATLWGETKTLSDPCPYGWKVAPAAAFAGLEIVEAMDNASKYTEKYGWTLTDGVSQNLFIAGGRRTYVDGKFQNVYITPDEEYEVRNTALYNQPWIGLYWTSDATAKGASALYFYFNKSHVENSRIEGIVSHFRANAMPVRCVRM